MDGLSAAANVIAVIQISGQVASLCRTYYLEVKDARREIQRLRKEVTALEDVLTKVAELADDPTTHEVQVLKLVNQTEGPVQQCQAFLTDLVTTLKKGQGSDTMKRFGLRALKWPFSSNEVKACLETIARHKATFTLALALDDIGLSCAIKADIAKLHSDLLQLKSAHTTLIVDGWQQSTEIRVDLLHLQTGQDALTLDARKQDIHHWLSAPDPNSNHHSACKKQQESTGAWFVEGDQYAAWKAEPQSFLWLHGIPGCGKTVLCSTIIQSIISHCQSDSALAVCFYYFDFNDIEKQKPENLVRSLIGQLPLQSGNSFASLDALYTKCQDGKQRPSVDNLASTLQQMLGGFRKMFIIIDALDECQEWAELIEIVESIVGWKLENLHLLVTSRRERDFMDAFEPLVTGQIAIQNETVNVDIQTHIRDRLRNDTKLSKWSAELKMEIESTLMDGARGMFRWVVCQLDELRKCLKPAILRNTLKSLPRTLDDTYARILCNIDEQYKEDAFKILQWLAYSVRPLSIEEMAEVLAVDTEGYPRIDPNNRLREPRDVLTICSSLVTTVAATTGVGPYGYDYGADLSWDEDDDGDLPLTRSRYYGPERPETRQKLQLAHFSVKEYLVSERIRDGPASRFKITKTADDYIAKTCLTYLLHFNEPLIQSSYVPLADTLPLSGYAGLYWAQHAQQACCDQEVNAVQQLYLANGAQTDLGNGAQAHLAGNTPLHLAVIIGNEALVELLLNHEADVNIQHKLYGTAFHVASERGYEAVSKVLINNGADVNALDWFYRTPLDVAIVKGHEGIIQLLLKHGARTRKEIKTEESIKVVSFISDREEAVPETDG
ncbi:hypothetical protein MMC11_007026 [Xylographa trunciseda]|nr:hypothetical protein [Xylographa trunciseda]